MVSEEGIQLEKKWLENYKKIDEEFARFLLLTHELSEVTFSTVYPNYSYVVNLKLDRATLFDKSVQTPQQLSPEMISALMQEVFNAHIIHGFKHSLVTYLQSNLLDSFNYEGKEFVTRIKEGMTRDAMHKLKSYRSIDDVKRNYGEYVGKFLYLMTHLYEKEKINELFLNPVSLNTIKPILDREVKNTRWFYTTDEIVEMQKRWIPELERMGLKVLASPTYG